MFIFSYIKQNTTETAFKFLNGGFILILFLTSIATVFIGCRRECKTINRKRCLGDKLQVCDSTGWTTIIDCNKIAKERGLQGFCSVKIEPQCILLSEDENEYKNTNKKSK